MDLYILNLLDLGIPNSTQLSHGWFGRMILLQYSIVNCQPQSGLSLLRLSFGLQVCNQRAGNSRNNFKRGTSSPPLLGTPAVGFSGPNRFPTTETRDHIPIQYTLSLLTSINSRKLIATWQSRQ